MDKRLDKRARKYLLITVFAVVLVSMGIALAYFAPSIQGTGLAGLNVSVDEASLLTFNGGDDFGFLANSSNFNDGAGNVYSDLSINTATLSAGSKGVITSSYNIYIFIRENTFEYKDEYENIDETTELILVIKDPNGNVYIPSDYEEVTSGDITGIDVTESSGLILLVDDYEIELGSEDISTTDEWTFQLYFINLDELQNHNAGKVFSGSIIMSQDKVLSTQIEGTLAYEIVWQDGGTDVIEAKEEPDFSSTATDDMGLYATTESYLLEDGTIESGTSYYYRGAVTDNWVQFGGYYWRIIRIDEYGNIKMIYAGTEIEPVNDGAISTSDTQSINTDTYKFNSSYNAYYYVGYEYSTTSIHGNSAEEKTGYESYIKTQIDSWFNTNITEQGYGDYLTTSYYCVDRQGWSSTAYTTEYISSEYSSGNIYYGAYNRLISTKSPSLECSKYSSDVFEYSVALISADEVALAGGKVSTTNSSYYLYTGFAYWTLSPSYFGSTYASVFFVTSDGYLSGSYVNASLSARPVVTLSSETLFSEGSGTSDDPYIVG